jgi:hypothetical protein
MLLLLVVMCIWQHCPVRLQQLRLLLFVRGLQAVF